LIMYTDSGLDILTVARLYIKQLQARYIYLSNYYRVVQGLFAVVCVAYAGRLTLGKYIPRFTR